MILVTGATGLVGSHLLLRLTQQNQGIKAIYRNPQQIKTIENLFSYNNASANFQKIHWVEADILDITSLELAFDKVSYVYHCAALVSFEPSDEIILQKTNIEGTANVVNLALAFGIKKFCHVSSIATIGENIDPQKILDEKAIWNPESYHSDYALTKYGAELEVWRASEEGLKVVIVNPGIILADSFLKHSSSELFQKIRQEFPFYTKGIASIVHIDDVVKLMIELMNSHIENENFILVSNNISYSELFNFIAKQMDKKPPFIHVNKSLSKAAVLLDNILSKVLQKRRSFTKSMALSSQSETRYSSEKIETTLSIQLLDYKKYVKEIVSNNTKIHHYKK